MDIAEHLDQLELHGRALGDAAERSGLDAPVPTCPEWDVRELLAHVGFVHRWAATFVRDGTAAFAEDDGPPTFPAPADGVVEWYREGHAALLAALRSAPDDLDAMTFLPNAGPPLAFWARRQAHETAVHRADAEAAAGAVPSIDPDFAVDGLGELLEGFYGRGGGKLRADPAVRLRVAPTDSDTFWRAEIGPDGSHVAREESGKVDCMIVGPAGDVYLDLWNRRPAQPTTVTGDETVMALWHRLACVQWG